MLASSWATSKEIFRGLRWVVSGLAGIVSVLAIYYGPALVEVFKVVSEIQTGMKLVL